MIKNYYRTLGILDDAEDIVIRAAYKALAQKHHPDKWQGDLKEASRRMSEINEAYDILSSPVKRKAFDATRERSDYQENGNNQNDLLYSVEGDWKKILEYFPTLNNAAEKLSKISKQLEFTYKVILIESKKFNKSAEIAQKLERDYLEKYFGTNEEVLNFGKYLILEQKKDAAKELNQAVKLLGSDVDAKLIIERIVFKFNLRVNEESTIRNQLKIATKNLFNFPNELYALNLLGLLRIRVEKQGWFKSVYLLRTGKDTYKMTLDEVIQYAKFLATKNDYIN